MTRTRRASRRSAAAFSLRRRAALFGRFRTFVIRFRFCLPEPPPNPQLPNHLRQPAPGRGVSPPGGAPPPPVCRLRAGPPGRRPSPRPGIAGRRLPEDRGQLSGPAYPACSATKTPLDDTLTVEQGDRKAMFDFPYPTPTRVLVMAHGSHLTTKCLSP